ncbi:MAG: hypothetical protein VW577_06760, partial [Pelagibacteraceae bacterium]
NLNTVSLPYGLRGEVSPDEAIAQQALARREMIANAMLQQGLQPLPSGQMVGRFYVPTSPFQHLANLAPAALGLMSQRQIGRERQESAARDQQQVQQALEQYRQAQQPRNVMIEQQGPGAPAPKYTMDELGEMNQMHKPGTTVPMFDDKTLVNYATQQVEGPRPTTPGTAPADPAVARQQMIEMIASRNPRVANLGQILLKLEEDRATQEANRAEKELDREVRRESTRSNEATRLAILQSNLQMREMELRSRERQGEDMKEQRAQLAKDKNELLERIAQLDAETKKGIAEAHDKTQRDIAAMRTDKLRPLPVSVSNALLENSENIRLVKTAIALSQGQTVDGIKGDANATGWKGILPEWLLQRVDPSGVDTRAIIANLGSMTVHDRTGTAQTAHEYKRLQPFIPKENDDPPVVVKKLKQFLAKYEAIQQEMTDFYTESNYFVPKNWERTPKVTGGGSVLEEADRILGIP